MSYKKPFIKKVAWYEIVFLIKRGKDLGTRLLPGIKNKLNNGADRGLVYCTRSICIGKWEKKDKLGKYILTYNF